VIEKRLISLFYATNRKSRPETVLTGMALPKIFEKKKFPQHKTAVRGGSLQIAQVYYLFSFC